MKNYLIKRKWIILVGVLVMVATSVPYLLGYASQGEEWHFTGFLIGVEDGNSYIAKMLTGAVGNWLFRSPYSSESQTGVLAFLPYLLLGKLTAGSAQHEQLVVLFHLFRFFGGILVTLAIDDFLSLFIINESQRRWALVVILLGGGMGWIVAVLESKNFLGSIPLDFLSPEGFGFLGLFGLPHLAVARAFLFWGAASYLGKGSSVRAGIYWLIMGLFQPMYGIVIWVVIGLHTLAVILLDRVRNRNLDWAFSSSHLKKALIAGAVSCPLILYTTWSFLSDPYLIAWTAQNYLPSPHWFHYLIAYGMILPFSIWGALKWIRIKTKEGLFLACWMMAFPFLVSAPVTTQRRLAEGIWVILIAAAFGNLSGKERIPISAKIITGLLFPTTFILLWGASSRAAHPSAPIFIPSQQVESYLALRDIAPPNSIVLSSFEVGNSLPAWVPVRVVQGHGPETVNLEEWQLKIDEYFMENQARAQCGDFFKETSIDYLFWGPGEAEQWNWDPGLKLCLRQVYNSNGYRIYLINE